MTAPGQGGTSQAQAESPQGANGTVGSVPIWLLILGMSGAAAVALLVQPISQAFASSAGLSSGLITQLRAHPRMFAVSGVFLLWSSVLSVYANTAGKSVLNQQVAVAGNKATPSNEPTPGDQSTPSSAPTDNGGSRAAGTVTSVAAQPLTGAAYYAHRAGVPHPPEADLFSGADNTVGLTNTTIQMCAHAALTFGPAFNIGASDLNVYWQMINAQGGIWGRKIVQPGGADGIVFNDDGYQPSRAVTAAQACHDQSGGDFVLLGGIGFDQIPAVRVWAEQNHMIYIHHIATQNGTQGLRFSFTMLPTLERIGIQFAQYYMHHEPGVKLGILYRNSSNWQPGLDAFMATLKAAGQAGNVVDMEPVNNNQGDYSAQITTLQARGSQEVFIYENALAAFNVISQASGQNWHPKWLLFPFNLTIENLDQASVDTSQMEGLLPAPAYTCNASNLPDEAAYKAEVQKFEAAYAKYDNGANLCGDGGDLLFATWLAWEQVYDLLYQCGPTCTRNAIAGLMLNGYHAQVGANCAVDFRGTDGHHGGNPDDLYHATRINGKAAWHNTGLCESDIQ